MSLQMTGILEPRSSWGQPRDCPMASALDVVHTRSAFLVLREAAYGATRYDEFTRRTGLSDPVTAARLRELTEAGILSREPYQEPGQRTRRQYLLTQKGAELLPVLVALMQWGDRWEQGGDGPVEVQHAGCGSTVTAQLRCADGHAVADGELQLVSRRSPVRQA